MERTYLKLHPHQALEVRCLMKDSPYRTLIVVGGVRSGKTLVLLRWLLDRSKWDTGQFHGLFAYTGPQIQAAILGEILPWLEMVGIVAVWNSRPPAEWYERWRKEGKKLPPRLKKYTNFLILSTGLHVYCGGLFNKRSYQQIRGMKLGSAVIEEFTAGPTEEAVRFVFERVTCGIGKDRCRALHKHTRILHGNPPEQADHFVFDWLARYNRQAKEKAIAAGVALPPEEENDAAAETYPYLLRGIGDVIYIPSRTIDNVANLPEEYIDDIANAVDEETAKRILHGVLSRTRDGRTYKRYSHKNSIRIAYDSDRTIYVALDFNGDPLAGLLAHPLKSGEFPKEHDVAGVRHVGVFGELFHVGGSDTADLCERLLRGDPGNTGFFPREFKGLLQHKGPIQFFGDATSDYKKTAGNDWQLVKKICLAALGARASINLPKRNSFVPVGVDATNAKLCSSTDIISLWIDLDLRELPQDLLNVVWDRTGKDVQKYGKRGGGKLFLRTHLSDALRYLIDTLFPLFHERKGRETRIKVRGTYQRPTI